jgi:ADP-ribose pyrophosphatase YjhB (NUDIX family)
VHLTTLPARPLAAPVVNGVVFRVSGGLETLLWRRAKPPEEGLWSLPGGFVRPAESLEDAMRRHLAEKVGVTRVGHLEQFETTSQPDSHPDYWLVDTAYMALIPAGGEEALPPDTSWHPVDDLPPIAFNHGGMVERARERLRGKLSYSNIAFALAPPTFTLRELADIYEDVLGYPVSPTNLGRVLDRDGLIEPTGEHRAAGSRGGRPAAVFRFRDRELLISRPLAAFRPPSRAAATPARSGG